MFTKERQKALLRLLERKRRLSNAELMDALGVSPATLRRDLADLEAEHQVVRFHGGAAHPSYLHGEPTLEQKSRAAMPQKRAIAAAAAELVGAQQTVFLDAGTTCLEVGRALMARRDLTLIANSIAFAQLGREANARVICLGGEVRGVTGALVGGLTLSWLSHLRADWAFIGASGLDEDGASTTELFEAEVKQSLLARAQKRVLVADAGKWDRPAPVRFAAFSDFEFFVTGEGADPAAIALIKKQGPRVIAVPEMGARERARQRKEP